MRETKDYSQMNDAEAFLEAINDAKKYLGGKKFSEIIAILKKDKSNYNFFRQSMAFLAGMEGYPVKAMYQYALGFDSIKPKQKIEVEIPPTGLSRLQELSELALKMEDLTSNLHFFDTDEFNSGPLESSIQTLVADIQTELDKMQGDDQ